MLNRQSSARMLFYSLLLLSLVLSGFVYGEEKDASADQRGDSKVAARGVAWLASQQAQDGSWSAAGNQYTVAMTALAGMGILGEGSTTDKGKYSASIRKGVGYLVATSQPNGLIGDPKNKVRYTYGHGFSMLFLSQVLQQEKETKRKAKLIDVLTKAVAFSAAAQTKAGGWGYVSAKEGNDFDEGSTTVTQLQGLAACSAAGIDVPKETIDNAIEYLRKSVVNTGGLAYSLRAGGGSGRPPITAAGVACLDSLKNDDAKFRNQLQDYCKMHFNAAAPIQGHWHYAHFYFAQNVYRDGGKPWQEYRDEVYAKLKAEAKENGSWSQGFISPVYTTALNLTILQFEHENVPIYRRKP